VSIDDVERLQMAQLIRQERETQEKRDAAREALATWVRRGKLAIKAGETELAREAKRRALEAKDELAAAEEELERLVGAKRRLRREARRPDEQPTTNAELLVEHFRLQGFAPEEQEMNEVTARAEAELAVDALKGAQRPAAEAEPRTFRAPGAPQEVVDAADAAEEAERELAATATTADASPSTSPPARRAPDAAAQAAVERELAALRASLGESAGGDLDDDALAELERALAEDAKPGDE
jgi:hypothetical protein